MSDYPGYSSPNAPQEGPPPPIPPQHGGAPVMTPTPLPPPEGKPRNTVGTIALVIAIVGFVFAIIPAMTILEWILLPIAFILAIVGLVQANKPKGGAIAAMILSVVGVIVAVIVTFVVVASAIDDAFSGETPEVTAPTQEDSADDGAAAADEVDEADAEPAASEEAPADETEPEEAPAGEEGSRSNPMPLGSTISTSEWQVKVIGFDPDATAQVLDVNMFNDEPAEGNVYALIEAEITYTGTDSASPWLDVDFAYVTQSGNTIRPSDSFVVGPDPSLMDIGELYEGASGTGFETLEIPADDDGLIRVTIGLFGDDVFVATE